MSALGQKQTFAVHQAMSALLPKADMCGATGDVRFGPIADIAFPNYFVIAIAPQAPFRDWLSNQPISKRPSWQREYDYSRGAGAAEEA
jgi:hypothetical protein